MDWKRTEKRWEKNIRVGRTSYNCFGVTNWRVGRDDRPWKIWVQFSILTFNIQVKWHILLIVWTILILSLGAQIVRWIGG